MSATLVAAVAMHSEMGDPVANLVRIEEWVDKAHEAGATFAVFPEECITGSLNKTDLSGDEIERIVTDAVRLSRPRLESLAARYRMTLVVGTIDKRGEKYGNAALIVGPDGYIATFYKLWLPNENESEFFEVGDELLVVGSQGWKFSIGICADMNRGEYFRSAADNGAELMLMPIAGSGYADLVGPRGGQSRQARKHRSLHLKIMRKHASANGLYVSYANQAGRSGDNWFPGLAITVYPDGSMAGEHLPTEGMVVVEVAKDMVAAARSNLNTNQPADVVCRNSAGKDVKMRLSGEAVG